MDCDFITRAKLMSELIPLHVPLLMTFGAALRFTTWYTWSRLLWLVQGWRICQKLRLVPLVWSLPLLKRASWCFEHLRSFDAKVWVGCPWTIKERLRIQSRCSNIVERTLHNLWCVVACIKRWTDMGNYLDLLIQLQRGFMVSLCCRRRYFKHLKFHVFEKKHLLELAASADSATGLHADRTGSRWTFVPAAVRQTSGTVWIVGSCWINGLLGLQALFRVKFLVNQFSDSGVALNFHMNIGGSWWVPEWDPDRLISWRYKALEGGKVHVKFDPWVSLNICGYGISCCCFFFWTCFHHYNHYKKR